ncbi:MAG: DUF4407 domain-containing protein, partial [Bifidobacteriaceae bacterium]|nr:DUF4407 domain-containing protein [Bifidobacteriaceae bacterium]
MSVSRPPRGRQFAPPPTESKARAVWAKAEAAWAKVRAGAASWWAQLWAARRARRAEGFGLHTRLALFAGMRQDMLAKCPEAVHGYFLKGLLFYVVASLAWLSMTFLLYSAFSDQLLGSDISYRTWEQALADEGIQLGEGAATPAAESTVAGADAEPKAGGVQFGQLTVALVVGAFWGFGVVLTIDRYLTKTMEALGPSLRERARRVARARWWRRAADVAVRFGVNGAQALPRIVLAALLGLVVSTPLTLQVFHQEIENAIRARIEAEQMQVVGRLLDDPVMDRAQAAREALRDAPHERAASQRDQEVAQLESALAGAREEEAAVYGRYTEKNNEAIAEATYGTVCNSGPTWGPCAQRLADEAASLAADWEAAKSRVGELERQIEDLLATELAIDSAPEQEELDKAVAAERILLENLRSEYGRVSTNTGLLAQIEAEWRFGGSMGLAHLVFLLVVFAIEMMPVLVQFLQNMRGSESHYEKCCRLLDESSTDDAERQRQAEEAERKVWWEDHLAAFKAQSEVQVRAAEHMAELQFENQRRWNNLVADRYWALAEPVIEQWERSQGGPEERG